MDNLTYDHIKRACYEAMKISKIAGWQFKGMPVFQWEFASMNDYHRARQDLLRAMTPDLAHTVRDPGNAFRKVSDVSEELDCYGVTFRLICHQRLMTPMGPYSAPDLSPPRKPKS